MIDQFVIPLLKILVVLNATLVGVTYMVLLERKVIAWEAVAARCESVRTACCSRSPTRSN